MDDGGKQRLRPFLEAQLNGGKVEGLRWLNPERTKFRVPWWHSGKPDWNRTHGQIFKEWAVHTGRYREGVDEEDWVNWKTRLRCALTKAADIVECKSESRLKADDTDPFRVYELRPREAGKKKTPLPHATAPAVSYIQGVAGTAPLPTVLKNFTMTTDDQIEEHSMPSDLNDVHKSDLVPACDLQVSQMSVTEADASFFNELLSTKLTTGEVCNDMELVLYYANNVVWDKLIKNSNGCRIYYGDGTMANSPQSFPVNLMEAVFGVNQAETFWLPPVDGLMDAKMGQHVQTVLERGMERGVLLQCSNGDIVAYRLCKCSIFFASTIGTQGKPIKLPLVLREKDGGSVEPTVIFDYNGAFLPALNQYALYGGPLPDPRVYLLIGSEKWLSDIDNTVPIYATVASCRAVQDLKNVAAAKEQGGRPAVQNLDVEDVVSEVKQMSLESIDLNNDTVGIPGYEFTPDPALLTGGVGTRIGQDPMLQNQLFDVGCPADQLNPLTALNFPATTIDADEWSKLAPFLDDSAPGDLTDFADLIEFH